MKYILLIFLGIHSLVKAQTIDVLSYDLHIMVTDESDKIKASNIVTVKFNTDCNDFTLDLVSADEDGFGMTVLGVENDEETIDFRQAGELLIIYPISANKGDTSMFEIFYEGIPKDGLIIGNNKYGHRTIFGDNWPDRAKNWFPCVDHPSDKALVNFTITAPSHFICVANGTNYYQPSDEQEMTKSVFGTTYPLPTKVMVFGLADFVVHDLNPPDNMPHSIYVFPEDKEAGRRDMSVATEVMDFYSKNIAPYPFEKLYNVQSTTKFGGMENAGCIFYDENAVTGKGQMENLIAHEIAHQWFGNSASEIDWQHLWLSEGFATYFTNLYLEAKNGRMKMNEQLKKDRIRVINFFNKVHLPIVDTISTDLMSLLNPNAYQKGSWFLHMLRYKLGDELFWEGIQTYYKSFEYKNASTNDFQNIMEEISKSDLSPFFDQWLRRSGHPMLSFNWKAKKKSTSIAIMQKQSASPFAFPIEIMLIYSDKSFEIKVFEITEKQNTFNILTSSKVKSIVFDPNVNLLFEQEN